MFLESRKGVMTYMTDEEKNIIKKEILKVYWTLPHNLSDLKKRYIIAVNIGLDNAQRKINENRKE
jgi:hypothetical protein